MKFKVKSLKRKDYELKKFKKVCNKCGELKFMGYFLIRRDSKDGYKNICKKCDNIRRKSKEKIVLEEKVCSKCNILKSITEFRKSSNSVDGHHSQCKICIDSTYTYICKLCGREFNTHHKDSDYCSPKCIGESQKRRIDYKCDYCGKDSFERDTEYNRYKNHYCSKDCKNKHRSELYVGEFAPMFGKEGLKRESHPRWNPNLTEQEREKGRRLDGYYDFIKNVYKRDNYTCQCCGDDKGGNLNAHHLDGYNWCKEKRIEVDNGICLCDKCHKKFHSIYGQGDNTIKQWLGFIKSEKELIP